MSWWVRLTDSRSGKTLEVDRHAEGGTYAMGGTTEAELNVTYKYGKHFAFRKLDGQAARDTIPVLESAVQALGTERSEDYWEPTPGNAGYALNILLQWARTHPEGVWEVD